LTWPNLGPVVQENPRKTKMPWPELGTVKTQALVQAQLDLY